jgi:N6-L-threonylcarbamoyladenine synthase
LKGDAPRRILAIETSCDETAAAILENGRELRANIIFSQADIHRQFGGVIPELASRNHLEYIHITIDAALRESGLTLRDMEGIAVSCGPGLAGALLVGVNTAKGLAYGLGLPLLGVNHIEGHIYANWLTHGRIGFPLIGLVVSGGHTALMRMAGHGRYELLGQTRDDSAGEAFDKAARAMGLPYPGGPEIDRLAAEGRKDAYRLPRALLNDGWEFSFSGLKTAVLRLIRQAREEEGLNLPDLAASFQESVVDILTEKTIRAAVHFGIKNVLMAGGVAANRELRERMARRARAEGLRLYCPSPVFCTDNAAMIACAAYYRFAAGERSGWDLNAVPGMKLYQTLP